MSVLRTDWLHNLVTLFDVTPKSWSSIKEESSYMDELHILLLKVLFSGHIAMHVHTLSV